MKVLAPVKKYETLRDPTIMHQECSVRFEKPSLSPAYMGFDAPGNNAKPKRTENTGFQIEQYVGGVPTYPRSGK